MVVKTNESDLISDDRRGIHRFVNQGGIVARLIHGLWRFNRKHFLIEDLSKNLDDERFLKDVGLTRAQVEKEIQKLRQSKI